MKFRSPHADAVDKYIPAQHDVRVTTIMGHVAIVSEAWIELPETLQQAALEAGCEVDKTKFKAKTPVQGNSKDAVNQDDPVGLAKSAIKLILERNNKEDFNVEGVPLLEVVIAVAGFKVSKSQLNTAWRELQAEAKA